MIGIGFYVGRYAQNIALKIWNAYVRRVTTDGGIIQNAAGALDLWKALGSFRSAASWIFIPSGIKAGKAYAQVPSSGLGDLDVTRASTATYTDATGTVVTAQPNVLRIDFRNADGSLSTRGRALLEPQRTNSIRNSSMVGAVAGSPGTLPTNWGVNSVGLTRTITAIGTENGLPYIEVRFNGTAGSSSTTLTFEQVSNISASAAQSWAESVYVRYINGTANSAILAWDEYTSGLVYLTSKASSALTIGSTLSRVSLTATTSTNCAYVQPFIRFALTSGQTYDFTIRIAAPQMELGAYATTWIPTTTAAVTRLADTASKTGISSLIGQTEGTLFVDMNLSNAITGTTRRFIAVGDGTVSNRIGIGLSTSNAIEGFVVIAGGVQALINSTTVSNQRYKIALAYKLNDVVLYINGAQIGVDTNATIPALANLYLAHEFGQDFPAANGHNQAVLFPTRLPNATLAQLTTL